MSRKMTSAEFQRREFEKECKNQLILAANGGLWDGSVIKRMMRAYDISEMRTALREAQTAEI